MKSKLSLVVFFGSLFILVGCISSKRSPAFDDSLLKPSLIDSLSSRQISSLSVSQNTSPFGSGSKIVLLVPSDGHYIFDLYNVKNTLIRHWEIDELASGQYEFDVFTVVGADSPSGVYILKVQDQNGADATTKITFLK